MFRERPGNKGGNVLEVVDTDHRKLNKTRGLAEGIARTSME